MDLNLEQQLLRAPPEARLDLLVRNLPGAPSAALEELAEYARSIAVARPIDGLALADFACESAHALGEARLRSICLRARAVALRGQARWADALEAFTEATRIAEQTGDLLLAARIPIAATDTLAQLGRFDEALALAASLEQRLRGLGAFEDAAKVLANAGNIHFQREQFAPALACWNAALEYFEQGGETIPAARLRMNVANVLTQLSRLPEALAMYESSRGVLERAGMDALVAAVDGNVAFLHFCAGRYADALAGYGRARDLFAKLELAKDVAQCDREVADIYLDLNLAPEARDAYLSVIPVFQGRNMSLETARSERGLSNALMAEGRSEEAWAALDRAEAIFQREGNIVAVARVRLQRAEWHRRTMENVDASSIRSSPAWREASSALQSFRKEGLDAGAAQARLCLLELRVQAGETPVLALRTLVRDAERAAFVRIVWRAEAALARACAAAGMERAATLHYRRAVLAVERVRQLLRGDDFQIAFIADKLRLFEELFTRLLDKGTPQALREAFQLAERSKSRALLDRLTSTPETPGIASPDILELRKKLADLREQMNFEYARVEQTDPSGTRLPAADVELPVRVRRLEEEYRRTEWDLALRAPAMDLGRAATLPRVADIQSHLSDGEQVVEYILLRDEIAAFVIDRRRFRVVRGLASLGEVEDQLAWLQLHWGCAGSPGAARRGGDAWVRSTLHRLHGLLLEPLSGMLTGSRLVIVPHGSLHSVPFHALHDGSRDALDTWEITYAPSSAVWLACRKSPVSSGRRSMVFALCQPGLEHIHREVKAVRACLPEAEFHLDDDATLSAVPDAGEFDSIHFATHGTFRQDNPLFSGLRLADGWLVAHDLSNRRLSCRLAVLSACQTGNSAVAAGDEIMGLARGFMKAGARGVLVSRWAADDRATATLMAAFYSRFTSGWTAAAALRAAQMELRRENPHPYYWAAFSLVGDA